jgi:glutamate-1-semialdehyde aminotransferase/spore coat polysaccharide biosynthesis protein SpsF (cytidylyltransferase family)
MIIAIIQARLNSSRLPGKVLAEIAGSPMLWHVVQRVRHARHVDQVVVATSNTPADDPVAEFCRNNDIPCYRGSEHDVLDRFYQTALHFRAGGVVRITADCPLIDPGVIDSVIAKYQQEGSDYVSNTLHATYPDGLDVEVFTVAALEQAWREAVASAQREHVTPYLRSSGLFRISEVASGLPQAEIKGRWTVDEEKDLEFVREVYQALGGGTRLFSMREVLNLLALRPDLQRINGDLIRNEGYYLSLRREPPMPSSGPRQLERTRAYLERAAQVIPSQTQTFSKGPTQFVRGVSPAFLSRGQGSHVWDVDGNEYIDYIASLCPVVLGYDYPAVSAAAIRQIHDGTVLSLPHPLEVELAERLVEIIPCAEMVRFGKNGSDVTAGAVRVARAFTGREKIACCGYHGWQDWYIGTTTRRLGVPVSTQQLTLPFQYNDPAGLERLFAENPNEIAAVIMEPVGVTEPKDQFLHKVKQLAHKHGALLIFDEIVTGFRMALGGAQEYFGVTPDLACFGKALANGFPLAAVVGARQFMKLFDDVFFSFTFGGEAVSLAAAIATIQELQEKNVIAHLWQQGKTLQDGYNVLAGACGLSAVTQCVGYAPRTLMTFQDAERCSALLQRSLLQQELVKRKVLFLAGANIMFTHTDADVEHTLRAYCVALEYLAEAVNSRNPQAYLEGEVIQPVFRRVA